MPCLGGITVQFCAFFSAGNPFNCPFNPYELGAFNLEFFQPKTPCEDFKPPAEVACSHHCFIGFLFLE